MWVVSRKRLEDLANKRSDISTKPEARGEEEEVQKIKKWKLTEFKYLLHCGNTRMWCTPVPVIDQVLGWSEHLGEVPEYIGTLCTHITLH